MEIRNFAETEQRQCNIHRDETEDFNWTRTITISPYLKPTAGRPLFEILITDPWTRVATIGVRKIRGRREREEEGEARKANHIIISLYSCRYEGKLY